MTVAHTNSPTQRALDRVLAGESVLSAARAEGIRAPGVHRALAHYRARGVRPTRRGFAPKPRDPKPVTVRGTAVMLRALDLVRGGATITAAARETGVDISNLCRCAKRRGIAVRRRGLPTSPKMERAIVDVLAGVKLKVAAESNNVRADALRAHVARVRKTKR